MPIYFPDREIITVEVVQHMRVLPQSESLGIIIESITLK